MAFDVEQFREWRISVNGNMTETYKVVDSDGKTIWRKYWLVNYNENYPDGSITIQFNSNGGSGSIDSITCKPNQSVSLPSITFTRTGCTLAANRWYDDPVNGTAYVPGSSYSFTDNKVLYAHWNKSGYTVSFNSNGGTGSMAALTCTINEVVDLPACTFVKTGYSFNEWCTIQNPTTSNPGQCYTDEDSFVMKAENMILYAQWSVNQYTATFVLNNGQSNVVKTQDYGTTLVAPTPTKEGYELTGWSPSVPSTMPASNATYTAQWGGITITNVNAVLVTNAKSQTIDAQNKSYGYMYWIENTDLPVWQTNYNLVFDNESYLGQGLTNASVTATGYNGHTRTSNSAGRSGIALKSLTPKSDVLYTKVKLSPYCVVWVGSSINGSSSYIINQWYWTDVSPQQYSMPGGSGYVTKGYSCYSRGNTFRVKMTVEDSAGTHSFNVDATASSSLNGWTSSIPSPQTLTFDFTSALASAGLKKGAKTTKVEFLEGTSTSSMNPAIVNAVCLYQDTLN